MRIAGPLMVEKALNWVEWNFRRFSIGPPCLGFRLVVWRGGLGRFPGGPYGKEL